MGGVREVFIFFMLLAGFAYAVSPLEGEAFANETVAAKCAQDNVQAVYFCSGDVVRVVSALPGAGSTFYTPEGKVISCPVVAPTEMGAECMHMMTPNFCLVQAECGSAPVEDTFPGQADSPEQTGDAGYYVDEETAATSGTGEETPEPVVPPKKPATPSTARTSPESDVPAPAAANFEFSVDGLVIVLFALGLVSVAVLFLAFRNSFAEGEGF